MKKSFYQYSLSELRELFTKNELPISGTDLLYNWHYKKKEIKSLRKDLAKKSISFVSEHFSFNLPTISKVLLSEDKTVKFLFEFTDNKQVETVLIPFHGKYSICLSSQVGCAMNCSFCFTGTQGLSRHLTTEEIVGQFIVAQRWLSEQRPLDAKILNIVFMGQGEPLHNFDEVKKACEIFLETKGICIPAHKITISTAGYLPGLKRWQEEMPQVNLALSLHSSQNKKRSQLIPLNVNYPLEVIIPLLKKIPLAPKRFITFEYLLIKDFNDQIDDAHSVAQLLTGIKAIVNLIPFNPFPGSLFKRPDDSVAQDFKIVLANYGFPTFVRKTKGDTIYAACGQLNSKKQEK